MGPPLAAWLESGWWGKQSCLRAGFQPALQPTCSPQGRLRPRGSENTVTLLGFPGQANAGYGVSGAGPDFSGLAASGSPALGLAGRST